MRRMLCDDNRNEDEEKGEYDPSYQLGAVIQTEEERREDNNGAALQMENQ